MNFIAIDFETADYPRNSACAIGLVRFVDGKPTDSFYSLIRPPELFILPSFTKIHGITVKDVQDELTFAQLWDKDILQFIQAGETGLAANAYSVPLVAHNAGFDMGVLRASLEHYGLFKPQMKSVCSLHITRKVWSYFSYHNLPFLAKHFGINYNAHNALDDALVCGKIVCLAAAEKDVSTLPTLLKSAGVPTKPL